MNTKQKGCLRNEPGQTKTVPTGSASRLVFYPAYCLTCQCAFVSDKRHARCWACNGTKTINCFKEMYGGGKQIVPGPAKERGAKLVHGSGEASLLNLIEKCGGWERTVQRSIKES